MSLAAPQPPQNNFMVAVRSRRADATNSGVWQRQKAQALIYNSAYVDLTHIPSGSNELFSHVAEMSGIADLQTVVYGHAEATYALVCKQLRSVGCPLWTDPPCSGDNKAIRVSLDCSDRGPDQCKLKKLIRLGNPKT